MNILVVVESLLRLKMMVVLLTMYEICQVDYVHLEADLGYIQSYKNL